MEIAVEQTAEATLFDSTQHSDRSGSPLTTTHQDDYFEIVVTHDNNNADDDSDDEVEVFSVYEEEFEDEEEVTVESYLDEETVVDEEEQADHLDEKEDSMRGSSEDGRDLAAGSGSSSGYYWDDSSAPPLGDTDSLFDDDDDSAGPLQQKDLITTSSSSTSPRSHKRRVEMELHQSAISQGAQKAMMEEIARKMALLEQADQKEQQRQQVLQQTPRLVSTGTINTPFGVASDVALTQAKQRLLEEIEKIDQAVSHRSSGAQRGSNERRLPSEGETEIMENRKKALAELRRKAAREELNRSNQWMKANLTTMSPTLNTNIPRRAISLTEPAQGFSSPGFRVSLPPHLQLESPAKSAPGNFFTTSDQRETLSIDLDSHEAGAPSEQSVADDESMSISQLVKSLPPRSPVKDSTTSTMTSNTHKDAKTRPSLSALLESPLSKKSNVEYKNAWNDTARTVVSPEESNDDPIEAAHHADVPSEKEDLNCSQSSQFQVAAVATHALSLGKNEDRQPVSTKSTMSSPRISPKKPTPVSSPRKVAPVSSSVISPKKTTPVSSPTRLTNVALPLISPNKPIPVSPLRRTPPVSSPVIVSPRKPSPVSFPRKMAPISLPIISPKKPTPVSSPKQRVPVSSPIVLPKKSAPASPPRGTTPVSSPRRSTLKTSMIEKFEHSPQVPSAFRQLCAKKPPALQLDPPFRSEETKPPSCRSDINKESSNPTADKIEKYYSLAELQGNRAEGIDIARREQYLSPEDFEKVFQISKDDFARLPKWKRDKAKRSAKLF